MRKHRSGHTTEDDNRKRREHEIVQEDERYLIQIGGIEARIPFGSASDPEP